MFSGSLVLQGRRYEWKLGAGGNVFFEVFDPGGTEICGGFGPADCRLTQAGPHTILVSEFVNDDMVGYALALERIVPPFCICTTDHSRGDGINGVGDIDLFFFGGATDDLVRVEIVELGGGGKDF